MRSSVYAGGLHVQRPVCSMLTKLQFPDRCTIPQ